MLRIRFQRLGKRKQPSYRIIVSEKTKDTQAGSLELLGVYNPVQVPNIVNVNIDRIKYWMSVGAELSTSVHNLLVSQGLIEGKKQGVVSVSKRRAEKLAAKKAAAEKAAA